MISPPSGGRSQALTTPLARTGDRATIEASSGPAIKIDLEDALKRKVDVVPARSNKAALRERILDEAREL
jgi:hypothetical protein